MYKLLRNRFDMVVTVSDSIHKFVIERRGQHPGRIKTIYYGVDLNTYSSEVKKGSLAAQLGAPTDKIFGVVAHFRTQKGHTYLVEAVPKVLRKYPHAKFVFVGTGREEENVKREVQGRGLSGNIIFLGLRYDIKELLNEFDVFILPSLWEGFPNVVLEAMACAKPVIGTAVEGTIELVRDGETGFLVPPRNPDALADAIVKILDHEELIDIFGRAGRKRVEENFTVERQVAEFEELYDALASRTLCIERSNSEGALKLGERVISNL